MVIPFPRRTRRRPYRLAWTAAWLAAGAVALSGVFIAGQDLLRGAREVSSVAADEVPGRR